MQNTLKTVDGRLVIVSGASRSGKTVKTAREVQPFDTVFVWDIEAQWCRLKGYKKITTRRELADVVTKGRPGKWAYVYEGDDLKGEFEYFARCVFYYGDRYGKCAVVAEELADVTTTAKAPPNWGKLIRRGLKRNISIFPISQRWAEADKTAIGNATEFLIFMSNGEDVDYISRKTRIPIDQIEKLRKLEYLHFVKETKAVTARKLTF